MKDIKELLVNKRLVSAISGFVIALILLVSASVPVLQDYTIVECEDRSNIDTCILVSEDLQTHILTIVSVFLEESFPVNPELPEPEKTELPEIEATPTQEVSE